MIIAKPEVSKILNERTREKTKVAYIQNGHDSGLT